MVVLTPTEAADALAGAQATMRRSRRVAVGRFLSARLVYWGIAWMIDYTALQFLPGWIALLMWVVLVAGAFATPRLVAWSDAGQSTVISGWQGQFRRAWWVVLFGSFALVTIVAPAPDYVIYLLLGALWGIAHLLYAVATEDRPLAFLGGGIVLIAVAARVFAPEIALLLFGLLAGGCMAIFGALRTWRQW